MRASERCTGADGIVKFLMLSLSKHAQCYSEAALQAALQ
jgi:hypothetical protein